MRKFLYILILLPLLASANSSFNNDGYVAPLDDPSQEERALNLGRKIKCVVCEGQSIEDSRADIALDMRRFIRTQIAEGKSDKEVIDIMLASYKDKYGDALLMMPPLKMRTIFLWLGPMLILLIGGYVMYNSTFRKKKTTGENK
ncbi:MAG: cytochrome c-type biogenesis protein [Alphaproteobacteria bacterium]